MGGKKRKAIAKEAKELAQGQVDDFNRQAKEQKGVLDKSKQEYKDMKFTNPYEGMQNQFSENVYEDLTVNQQQAQFQAQQGAQQRSNIMQGLRGSAGGSGIAGLAQSMANQGQLQTQKISASIGAQESQNQAMRAKGQLQVQTGAAAVDLQKRQGDAAVQQAESAKAGTLLGMEFGAMAGINEGKQAAMANQMSAMQLEAEMKSQAGAATKGVWGQSFGALAKIGGAAASDRRLKKNINKTGESPSGLNIYSFEYKNPTYGKGLFQGVMSDEIPQEAVHIVDGYDMVDYGMLDVEFKKID